MMRKNIHLLVCVMTVIAGMPLTTCDGRGTGPAHPSPLIQTVYVNDCNSLVAFDSGSETPTQIFEAPTGWSIQSFKYSVDRSENYFVLTRKNDEDARLETRLIQLHSDGRTDELIGFSSCTDCEGYSALGRINLSPDERYLAIDTYCWECGNVQIFDLQDGEMVDLQRQWHYEYLNFQVWYPHRKALIARSLYAIHEIDLETQVEWKLPSPNIRDYLSETELLSQGFLGDRVNYERLVGRKWLSFINWHPGGWHFAFERGDSLFLFDLSDSTEALLHTGSSECRNHQLYDVVWASGSGGEAHPPDFGNRDIIISLDSVELGNIVPLNDSVSYEKGRQGSISYLETKWGESYWSGMYLFRGSVSSKKIHLAEFDFLLWVYAIDLKPRFWSGLNNYARNPSVSDLSFARHYQELVEEYETAIHMFNDFRYPPALMDRKPVYDSLVARNFRFERALASYLASRDRDSFMDTISLLLPSMETPALDTFSIWIAEFEQGDRSLLVDFYAELYRWYLNYYGLVLGKEMDRILDSNLIEEFHMP